MEIVTRNDSLSEEKSISTDSCGCTRMKLVTTRYAWKIINFSYFCAEEIIESPTFSPKCDKDLVWKLQLHSKADAVTITDSTFVFLHLVSSKKPVIMAHLRLSIINNRNEKTNIKSGKYEFNLNYTDSQFQGFDMFKRDFLKEKVNELLPKDTLTILCEISAGVKRETFTFQNSLETYRRYDCITDNFEQLFESKEFSDVKLVIGQQEIQSHKAILAARSSVFKALFQHGIKKNQDVIRLTDIKYEVLKEMLRYVYCAKTQNLENISEDLLAAAQKFDIKGLKIRCEMMLCKKLTEDNALRFLELAYIQNADKLKNEASDFIRKSAIDFNSKLEFIKRFIFKPDLVAEIHNKKIKLN